MFQGTRRIIEFGVFVVEFNNPPRLIPEMCTVCLVKASLQAELL